MKIYHTETQADFDALMEELEAEGKTWWTGRKATESNIWNRFKSLTCIVVGKNINGFCYKKFYKEKYPDVPIIKYKAKADEKMRFTKSNIEGLVNKYFDDNVGECPGNLIAEIYAMDDTPEKAVVPKYVADWIGWNKANEVSLQIMLKCYNGFYENADANVKDGEKAVQWYVDNPYKFIRAYEEGYTIEPEQLYYIPLPHLETAGGTKQYLTKSGAGNYFALSPCVGQKQRYTKEELERVPEVYKFYAKLIEEEEE